MLDQSTPQKLSLNKDEIADAAIALMGQNDAFRVQLVNIALASRLMLAETEIERLRASGGNGQEASAPEEAKVSA